MKQWKDELSLHDDGEEADSGADTLPSDPDHMTTERKNSRTSDHKKVCWPMLPPLSVRPHRLWPVCTCHILLFPCYREVRLSLCQLAPDLQVVAIASPHCLTPIRPLLTSRPQTPSHTRTHALPTLQPWTHHRHLTHHFTLCLTVTGLHVWRGELSVVTNYYSYLLSLICTVYRLN